MGWGTTLAGGGAGRDNLTLREPGNYTIFYEYHSVIGDKLYSTDENLSGLACVVVPKARNSIVALSPSSMSSTYEFGGRSGSTHINFKVDQPGIYALSAGYRTGQQGPEVVLAVGRDFTTGLFVTILGALALLFGSIGIAVAITLVTLLKRSKKKKLLAGQA